MVEPDSDKTVADEIPTLADWVVLVNRVCGYRGAGHALTTSPVMQRQQDVITTHSGSRYRLLTPACAEPDQWAELDVQVKLNQELYRDGD